MLMKKNGKLQGKAKKDYNRLLKMKANAEARKIEAEKKRQEAKKEKEKANLIGKRNGLKDKIATLSNQKNEFFTNPDAIKQRMINYRSGANPKELKASANEVMQLIMAAILARKQKSGPESMGHDIELDDDELDEANAAHEYIKKALTNATLMHSGVDFDDMISRTTDLDPADPIYEDLKNALSKYFMEFKKNELASAWQKSAQYNGDPDAMDDEMITILMSKILKDRFRK